MLFQVWITNLSLKTTTSNLLQCNITITSHFSTITSENMNHNMITINHHLIILKTFINDYTPIEYTRNLKLIKTTKRKPQYLTIEQIKTALKYTDNKTDELIIKVLSNTGLRIHEALKIAKKELENTDEQGHVIITVTGKNNKRRLVVIPEQLNKDLKKYSKNNKKYVFESKRQPLQHMSNRGLQHRFKKLAASVDESETPNIYSENLKPHNLRHSFAIEAQKQMK